MAINFSDNLIAKVLDAFARPITVTPLVSAPGNAAYAARAYFDSSQLDILTEDGGIHSDSKAFIDIRVAEFAIVPMQGDAIDMAFHEGMRGGSWEVLDAGESDAAGTITLTLRKLTPAKPPGITYQPLP
jgi:hypothetical protein